jgi:hypothetical protein
MYVRRRKRFAQCESEGEGKRDEQNGCLNSITLITDLLSALQLPAHGAFALWCTVWRLIRVQIRGVGGRGSVSARGYLHMLMGHLPSDTREP